MTSSPYHPEGNGEAERGVQIVKNLLKKAKDPYLAMLALEIPCLAKMELVCAMTELAVS